MNIGFVSTWLQRGAAYVTMSYIKMLQPPHKAFVYGRGGEYFDARMVYDHVEVHRALRLDGTDIYYPDFRNWIKKNRLDIVLMNEQDSIEAVCKARLDFPYLIFGAYIDYYKENTIKSFAVYDFLICNTRRHFSVFSWHPACYYIKWGVDVDLYKPSPECAHNDLTFFHSMGMSDRKGTDILIRAFREGRFREMGARLIIHTQKNISSLITAQEAEKDGIQIIQRSVSAPGLYSLGDVYVYPARLDGLGLTIYEALACGLPIIATDAPPMNEVVNDRIGKLVPVERAFCRSDGYYWPMSEVSIEKLKDAMSYYVNNKEHIAEIKKEVRNYAIENYDIESRREYMLRIIKEVKRYNNDDFCREVLEQNKIENRIRRAHEFADLFTGPRFQSTVRSLAEKRRRLE